MTWTDAKAQTVTFSLFVFALFSFAISRVHALPNDDADSAAINQRISEFTNTFNRHDPHAFATLFAEDVDFTNIPGNFTHGRTDLEEHMTTLFTGFLKGVQRMDSVKRIRFLTPEIASVDADWVLTGMKLTNGSVGIQKGLLVLIMTKQNDNWFITVFHEPMLSEATTPAKQ